MLLLLVVFTLVFIWLLKNKVRRWITLVIALLLVLWFGLTYIPHSVVSIDPGKVSKITVFDGGTGNSIDITNRADIDYIINNLNGVTFQKGKSSFGYMGYSFRTTIYNQKGKAVKELIINASDTIRYKGFFYTAKDRSIDYDYIDSLFD
jgi:hypothetical protein